MLKSREELIDNKPSDIKVNHTNYSLLMTVYDKEKPEFLYQSIQSIVDQTVKTDDFVLVCDGKLNKALENVINEFEKNYPTVFNVIKLEKNVGIGEATNIGLKHCKNELIAKMDSDDISHRDRCAIQLDLFNKYPNLSIIGTDISEFEDEVDNIVSIRSLPPSHEKICTFAKRRSPFNNQTIMYKKQDVLTAGGYSPYVRCEDYDLFVRVISAGFQTMNINKSLVNYRLTDDSFKKRASFKNTKSFISVRWKIYKSGYSSFFDFFIPCLGQICISVLPITIIKRIYKKFLRKM